MSITIKDIARIAGVTHSTVSRSLNNSPLVSEDTKIRIQAIAREHGYQPNQTARKLAKGKSRTLGVFFLSRGTISMMENFGTQFLEGIAKECEKKDYDLLLMTPSRKKLEKTSFLEICSQKNVEGAIFLGVGQGDLPESLESSIPISLIDYPMKGSNLGYVTTDTRMGIRLALDYLEEMGHQKIGFIRGPRSAPIAADREREFKLALMEKGLFREEWIWEGDFSRDSGYKIGEKIIGLSERPTAIFSSSDLMAMGLIQALQMDYISVPDEISVIGYDDALPARYFNPALTTIAQDAITIGSLAADFIFQKLSGQEVSPFSMVAPKLMIRKTVRQLSS